MDLTVTVLLVAAVTVVASTETDRDAERHRVVVVGAGVAGFTAAATLLEHNVTDILVLEASDRIGGRIHTVQFGDVPIDKGAEFVHGEQDNSVFKLVSRFNFLASYDALLTSDKYLFANASDGQGVHSTEILKLINKALDIFGEYEIGAVNGSLGDYFYPRLQEVLAYDKVNLHLGEAIRHLVALMECIYNGADTLYDAGARGDYEGWENEGDLSLKWRTRGYNTLFDIISKKFPDPSEELPVMNKTKLNKQVTQIKRRESDVQVTCADGSTYLADHVIVTVSLGVLKRHAVTMFQPSLPADKTAAIEAIHFGCVGKIFVLFPNRWWSNDTNAITPLFSQQELDRFKSNSIHGHWTSNITGFYPVMNHERMLCAWLAGRSCRTMEYLAEDQVTEGIMELLQALLGKMLNIPRPDNILRTTWESNPYTFGSYSYRSVGSDRLNLTNDHLATPIMDGIKPIILFAGEATHLRYAATVHGALDTGRREALRILSYKTSHATLDDILF